MSPIWRYHESNNCTCETARIATPPDYLCGARLHSVKIGRFGFGVSVKQVSLEKSSTFPQTGPFHFKRTALVDSVGRVCLVLLLARTTPCSRRLGRTVWPGSSTAARWLCPQREALFLVAARWLVYLSSSVSRKAPLFRNGVGLASGKLSKLGVGVGGAVLALCRRRRRALALTVVVVYGLGFLPPCVSTLEGSQACRGSTLVVLCSEPCHPLPP